MTARRSRNTRGFTLLEMAIALAIVAILAAVATPLILQRLMDARIEATREEVRNLYEAMVGRDQDGDSFGFVGDIGGFPSSFEQLVQPAGLPGYSLSNVRGIGMGWKGPYVNTGTSATDYLMDAFGRRYTGASTGQVRSAGPDGVHGSVDDIVYPPSPPVITGRVHVNVKTILDRKTINDPDGYAVDLYYASGGVQSVVRDASRPFRFDNVPMGLHAILVVNLNGGGVVAQDTIALRPGSTALAELWF